MRSNTYCRLLIAIIGLHLILGLVYDWATPILEASDEGHHYAVIHWLALGNPLPVQNPENPQNTWAQEGTLPAFRLGRLWRFRRAEIDAWLESHRRGPAGEKSDALE